MGVEGSVGGGGGVRESSEAPFKKVKDLILLLKWVDWCPHGPTGKWSGLSTECKSQTLRAQFPGCHW